jgi:hypothetical protein
MVLVILTSFTPPTIQFALLKYNGGGDWYNDVHSLSNLALFCNENLNMNIDPEYATVEAASSEIFNYPFVYMTGHGNVVFSQEDAANLRNYLMAGGFLFVNDDYGMDPYIRPELKKVFPDAELIELPFTHPVYHQRFRFPNGLPKIHEHDGLPPKGYGILYEGRLVVFYNFETDLGDGWDDVHNDEEKKRVQALQAGANIIQYVFSQQKEKP